ncbi:MAG: SDR family oxidoreductase [Bacteroidota bacterium]|nr:SDR family oxidoreductase [Bacteroidota bacterium]
MNTGLNGKTAIVTGATQGIGKAIALALANEGVRLILCARTEEQLQQTETEIKDRFHTEVTFVKANLTRTNDIKRVVTKAISKYKRVDILVNNAGGAHIGGIFEITDEIFEAHIHLKLLGYIRFAREVIPYMRQQGGGRIINVIGTAGKEPKPTLMLPGITNGALLNFTKSLALELAKDNITVNAVNPGTTDTPLTEQTIGTLASLQNVTPDEMRQMLKSDNPFGRLVRSEEVASAVVFLASEAANFISGISMNVDGGTTRGTT